MKVKVGDHVYDSDNEPVMVILSVKDKENIANMLPNATKYCAHPASMDSHAAMNWMGDV